MDPETGYIPDLLKTAIFCSGSAADLLKFMEAPVALQRRMEDGSVINLNAVVLNLKVSAEGATFNDYALGGAALAILTTVLFNDLFVRPGRPLRQVLTGGRKVAKKVWAEGVKQGLGAKYMLCGTLLS